MGDYILTHDDEGKAYLRRAVYINLALYIGSAILFVTRSVNMVILALIAAPATVVTLGYALWFIHKHPPIESEDMQFDE